MISKLGLKHFLMLGAVVLASMAAFAGCGSAANNVVPAAPAAAAAGITAGVAVGQCACGLNYLPGQCGTQYANQYGNQYGNQYSGAYGGTYGYGYTGTAYPTCAPGYILSGNQCVCSTSYYGNAQAGGAYGGCPVGYTFANGQCVYSQVNYGGGTVYVCPGGRTYRPGYGCL